MSLRFTYARLRGPTPDTSLQKSLRESLREAYTSLRDTLFFSFLTCWPVVQNSLRGLTRTHSQLEKLRQFSYPPLCTQQYTCHCVCVVYACYTLEYRCRMYALVPRLSNHDPTVLYGQPSRLEEWAGALTRSLRTLTQLQREARLRHSLREAYAHLRHCSRRHAFALAYAKLWHTYTTAVFLPVEEFKNDAVEIKHGWKRVTHAHCVRMPFTRCHARCMHSYQV